MGLSHMSPESSGWGGTTHSGGKVVWILCQPFPQGRVWKLFKTSYIIKVIFPPSNFYPLHNRV